LSQFFILPEAFLRYVAEFKRIPVPLDIQPDTLQSLVETVCLEASIEEKPEDNQNEVRQERDIPLF